MAKRRINKELEELGKEPIAGCTAEPKDDGNIMEWRATIKGPPDSPYEGGTFKMDISFPRDYPFSPPLVNSTTRIFHPNIDAQGGICLDILDCNWAPSLTISKVLLSISSLLCDPNPNSPMDVHAARLYRDNREEFDRRAREYTQKHAMG